jgi:hypothetical protein
MTNTVEELRNENTALKKDKENMQTEMQKRLAEGVMEARTSMNGELLERARKSEAEKDQMAIEITKLKSEKSLLEKTTAGYREKGIEYDRVQAKLEAVTAERNYFEE